MLIFTAAAQTRSLVSPSLDFSPSGLLACSLAHACFGLRSTVYSEFRPLPVTTNSNRYNLSNELGVAPVKE